MEHEDVLKERVAKSPLNFFLQRFRENNKVCSINQIPKPDTIIYSGIRGNFEGSSGD